MLRTTSTLAAAALAAALATAPAPTLAQDEFATQIAARKGQMQVMALHLGLLGGMARGNVPYDAETATVAAENLQAVALLHQDLFWPEGSGSDAIEGTRALPAIWENWDDFLAKHVALEEAVPGIVEAAGSGVEAIGPALGPIGQACQACHESYQLSD